MVCMHSPAPSRKSLLQSAIAGGPWRPFAVLAIDVVLFAVGSTIALYAGPITVKLLGSLLIAAGIVRLFLIGHEACHGSFFVNDRLNQIVGRLVFLPSLTAFSLWDVGHNVAHHGFNNLKGRDQVWTPFSKQEFDALTPRRQLMERIYRSGAGCGLYYFLELWWKKLYFASRREIGSERVEYKLDSLLVTAAAIAWLVVVALVARDAHTSFWLLALVAVILPFALWNCIMGFVVFIQHTHPAIAWFQKRQEWQRCRAYLTATANVHLPLRLDRLMHGIMEHNAHHVNTRISMFGLNGAQRQLIERDYGEVLSYRLDYRRYVDVVSRCKLYDYVNHAWLDWSGAVTAQVTPFSGAMPA